MTGSSEHPGAESTAWKRKQSFRHPEVALLGEAFMTHVKETVGFRNMRHSPGSGISLKLTLSFHKINRKMWAQPVTVEVGGGGSSGDTVPHLPGEGQTSFCLLKICLWCLEDGMRGSQIRHRFQVNCKKLYSLPTTPRPAQHNFVPLLVLTLVVLCLLPYINILCELPYTYYRWR